MSPRLQETGSRASSRQRQQDENVRNESRDNLADDALHADLARARSCEVKTGRDVFRLPARIRINICGAEQNRRVCYAL